MLIRTTLQLKAKEIGATDFNLSNQFEETRLSSDWYGGEVVSFKFDGHTFNIIAEGNTVAELINGNDILVYVKDRANNGNFKDQMKNYISDDTMLQELKNNYDNETRDTLWLNVRESNWFTFETDHPKFESVYNVLDSSDIDGAVVEVFDIIK